jgi:hypothetical protein
MCDNSRRTQRPICIYINILLYININIPDSIVGGPKEHFVIVTEDGADDVDPILGRLPSQGLEVKSIIIVCWSYGTSISLNYYNDNR